LSILIRESFTIDTLGVIVKVLELDRSLNLKSLDLLYHGKIKINIEMKMFILTFGLRLMPIYARHYLKLANGNTIPLSPNP
jgi:hypothetical protein